jgi:phage-related protein
MKKVYEEAKKQMDLMETIGFPLDENGDIDTDRANDVIFEAAKKVVAGLGENYEVFAGEIKAAATGFGEVGQAVVEIADEFGAKTLTQVINAILFELATSGLHQEQFPGTPNLNETLAQVIATLCAAKAAQDIAE